MTRFAFHYRAGRLFCEGVELAKIAKKVGTPVYVYSETEIRKSATALVAATRRTQPTIHYAVKANSNLALLRIFKSLGFGFDVVSAGELYRLSRIGVRPNKIVFSGVGKTRDEIRMALGKNTKGQIASFNVESPAEIEMLLQTGRKRIPVLLRFNPNVDAETHPHITTGKDHNKFGMSGRTILKNFPTWRLRPEIEILGLSVHIGSQILSMRPFEKAFAEARSFLTLLNSRFGTSMTALDVGGGLGVPQDPASSPPWSAFGQTLETAFQGRGLDLHIEPGRALVARAGALVTTAIQIKTEERTRFLTVDAGMNDLIRPALYGARHPLWTLKKFGGSRVPTDVVGPVCESADAFGSRIPLPSALQADDVLAIMNAGAYGFSMASQYNSRPRPAEVLVSGGKYRVIRRRENYEDLCHGET